MVERSAEVMERNFFQCHVVHHKYHTYWPGNETWLSRWDAGDQPADLWPDAEGYQNIRFMNCELPLRLPVCPPQHIWSVK